MSTSLAISVDWTAFLEDVGHRLKKLAADRWKLQPDGSGHDTWLALRRLFDAFPFPLDVALVGTTGIESNRKDAAYATLFRYDIAQRNTLAVRFHGVIQADDLSSHLELLQTVFGFEEDNLGGFEKLNFSWQWAFPHFTQLVMYDPVSKAEDYARDLLDDLSSLQDLVEEFSPKIDFNHKYALQANAILEEATILQVSELSSSFAPS